MYQFDKIKLIIWDLDDTFWNGILSEGEVVLPTEHIELIHNLTDAGIVNSICSKNDFEKVYDELNKYELKEYFVFPSVNWEPKGLRVKQIISDMQLRDTNVLFIDDNHSNREEVRYYCPDIMIGSPDVIIELINDVNKSTKKDKEHKRLNQYHILEAKRHDENNYSSNEDFLMASNIIVEIKSDCDNHIERIHDLILRSNQLNFTKIRSSVDELRSLICDDSIEKAYVSVHDKFGEYGIVGFYAIKDSKLIHYVFSCRTLGMGIEQYVYNYLDRPELEICGEVVSDLNSTEIPKWINQDNQNNQSSKNLQINGLRENMVLIKGPCDLFQIYPYIANTELFDTDFSHTTDSGVYIESTSHTTHMVEAIRLNEEQKNLICEEVPFIDLDVYDNSFAKKDYKIIVISILQDANLGVYRRKNTGERFAFLEYLHPMTDKKNWDKIISGEYHNAGFEFNTEVLKDFAEKYEFVGRNTPEQIVENLDYLRANINKHCVLCIMLGGELYYEKNTFEAYNDRHIVHKQINDEVRLWAKKYDNVQLIDVNKYLVDQSSFYDHFNHYIKPVYYALAKEMVDIVNNILGTDIKQTSKTKMLKIKLKEGLAPFYYKIRKKLSR